MDLCTCPFGISTVRDSDHGTLCNTCDQRVAQWTCGHARQRMLEDGRFLCCMCAIVLPPASVSLSDVTIIDGFNTWKVRQALHACRDALRIVHKTEMSLIDGAMSALGKGSPILQLENSLMSFSRQPFSLLYVLTLENSGGQQHVRFLETGAFLGFFNINFGLFANATATFTSVLTMEDLDLTRHTRPNRPYSTFSRLIKPHVDDVTKSSPFHSGWDLIGIMIHVLNPRVTFGPSVMNRLSPIDSAPDASTPASDGRALHVSEEHTSSTAVIPMDVTTELHGHPETDVQQPAGLRQSIPVVMSMDETSEFHDSLEAIPAQPADGRQLTGPMGFPEGHLHLEAQDHDLEPAIGHLVFASGPIVDSSGVEVADIAAVSDGVGDIIIKGAFCELKSDILGNIAGFDQLPQPGRRYSSFRFVNEYDGSPLSMQDQLFFVSCLSNRPHGPRHWHHHFCPRRAVQDTSKYSRRALVQYGLFVVRPPSLQNAVSLLAFGRFPPSGPVEEEEEEADEEEVEEDVVLEVHNAHAMLGPVLDTQPSPSPPIPSPTHMFHGSAGAEEYHSPVGSPVQFVSSTPGAGSVDIQSDIEMEDVISSDIEMEDVGHDLTSVFPEFVGSVPRPDAYHSVVSAIARTPALLHIMEVSAHKDVVVLPQVKLRGPGHDLIIDAYVFAIVTRRGPVLTCTCKNFDICSSNDPLRQLGSGPSCMHTHFYSAVLQPLFRRHFSKSPIGGSPIEARVSAQLEDLTSGRHYSSLEKCTVRHLTTSMPAVKFAVNADDIKPSFVSFDPATNLMICQRAFCSSGKREGMQLPGDPVAKVGSCRHVRAVRDMECFREFTCDGRAPERVASTQPERFDEETGKYVFPAFSKYTPVDLASYRMQHHSYPEDFHKARKVFSTPGADAELRKSPFERNGWFVRGPLLLPTPVPLCMCGVPWKTIPSSRHIHVYTRLAPFVCVVAELTCQEGRCASIAPDAYDGKSDFLWMPTKNDALCATFFTDHLRALTSSKDSVTFRESVRRFSDTYCALNPKYLFVDTPVFIEGYCGYFNAIAPSLLGPCPGCEANKANIAPYDGYCPPCIGIDGTGQASLQAMKGQFPSPYASPGTTTKERASSRYERCAIPNRDTGADHLMDKVRKGLRDLGTAFVNGGDQSLNTLDARFSLPEGSGPVAGLLDPNLVSFLSLRDHLAPGQVLLSKAFGHLVILSSDICSVTTLVPARYLEALEDLCGTVDEGNVETAKGALQRIAGELLPGMQSYLDHNGSLTHLSALLSWLCSRSRAVTDKFGDQPVDPDYAAFPESYNPVKFGMAFSCDESGRQARSLPRYFDYNKSSSRDTDEDRCGEHCSKPSLDSGGATCTHTLLVFSCILHGHILGHAFVEREGRRDVFALIFRFFRVCPRQIMYDFACSLEETALNREPRFFENARISSDTFHASNHKCAKSFNWGLVKDVPTVKSSTMEHLNSLLRSATSTMRAMGLVRGSFYIQLLVKYLNLEKRLKRSNDQLESTMLSPPAGPTEQ